MTSTPSFSMTLRQIDIVIISGCMIGLYLTGLAIGERIQLLPTLDLDAQFGSIGQILFILPMPVIFLMFAINRTLANMVVKQ